MLKMDYLFFFHSNERKRKSVLAIIQHYGAGWRFIKEFDFIQLKWKKEKKNLI